MYSSARNDHRQPECMNQVLVITMCARAIGGPLKLKKRNCILCAQSQEPPPPESLRKLSLILFGWVFSFAPHRPGAVSATV